MQGTVTTFTNPFIGGGALNLVTNPYASPIDWSLVQPACTNVTQFYTLWDASIGYRGGFVTVSTAGVKSDPLSNATINIQPGQAFFVESNGAIPTVSIQEGHKVAGNNNGIYGPLTAPQQQFSVSLFYTEGSGFRRVSDAVTAIYGNGYSAVVNSEDAKEVPNWDENIAIARDGKHLSIETRPLFAISDSLPLFMERMKVMNYELQLTGSNFADPSITATLIDNFTGKRTTLSVSGTTVVPFSVSSVAGSYATDRFLVVFGPSAITISKIKAYQKNLGIEVDWTMQSETDMDRYEVEKSADGNGFTKVGTVASQGNSNLSVSYGWFDAAPFTGDNFYRIKAINKDGQIRYSNKVVVNISKGIPIVNIYPNPIDGNNFNLEMKNMTKGTYEVVLINQLGQQVFHTTLIHNGGSASENITLKNNLPAGVYELQVSGGEVKMGKRIVKE